ncbi:hypothetical protein MBLNU13_g11644t1 [Cladosporium sp. NU13]
MSLDAITKIKNLLPDSLFSDLAITCGDKEWKVHKAILWIQSEYFRKLLCGKFKEANATTLDLSADDPTVLAALIHYFYNFTLRENSDASAGSNSSHFVHVYAIADKYDVPHLRTLAKLRLQKTFNTQTALEDHADLIETVRAVDECSPHRFSLEGENGLWAVMLPVMKSNIAVLLQNEAFKELLLELPDLNFRLLAMLDSAAPEPSVKRARFAVSDSDDGEDDENYAEDAPSRGTLHYRFGRGRTLG